MIRDPIDGSLCSQGCLTALITPFRNGQIKEGINGVFGVCGATGESPTLTRKEHMRLIELCIEATKRRVPVSHRF